MNKAPIVNISGSFEKKVLRILREIPGVDVQVQPTLPDGKRPDFVIRAGNVQYVIEVKAQLSTNAAGARQVVEYARQLHGSIPVLLIAQSTTKEARQILEDSGVALIDGLGNMRVELPGLFLRTEGLREASNVRNGDPPVKLSGKAGVAAQALLQNVDRKWQVHDLSESAKISVGMAHRVLARLEREGLVDVIGGGPNRTRLVNNPAALLDLWTEEMRDRGVKQFHAFKLARDPQEQASALSDLLSTAKIEHVVTGAAAASFVAPFITAIPIIDIWVSESVRLEDVAVEVHADLVNEGHNIVFRQAQDDVPLMFRQEVHDVWLANRFRLYYDLRQDPRRGREQADRLRKEVIGF